MKTLLYAIITLLAVGIWACNDKDDPKNTPGSKFNRNARVHVNPYHSTAKKAVSMGYEDSIRFIVRFAAEDAGWSIKNNQGDQARGINRNQRDTINNRFVWFGSDVVRYTDILPGNDTVYALGDYIVDSYNIIYRARFNRLTNEVIHPDSAMEHKYWRYDTIAYIPNAVITKARELITAAFEKKDYKRCYELFDSAYVFIPTTGEKYRALMEKGEN